MSGTIIPGQTLTLAPTNRQTLPYGDRPLVRIKDGQGFLTPQGYQFLQRLLQGVVASITNVGTIAETTNTIIVDLATIEAEINTLFADVAEIEQQLTAGLAAIPPPPSPIIQGTGIEVSPLPAPSFDFIFGQEAQIIADARACAFWGF